MREVEAIRNSIVDWCFQLIDRAYTVDWSAQEFKQFVQQAEVGLLPCTSFVQKVFIEKELQHHIHFDKEMLVCRQDGRKDYLSTMFYLVNCLQEYGADQLDRYGRFKYSNSLQQKFDCLTIDVVKHLVDEVLRKMGKQRQPQKSRIMLSHDIDSLHGAWKHESRWALKKKKIGTMMKVILNTAIKNPPWWNLDRVLQIETEKELQATYFWIVESGRDANGIKNGDYDFQQDKIQSFVQKSAELGCEHGLHKSTLPTSFRTELDLFGREVKANRFHFLKYQLPSGFQEIENSSLKADCSVCFAYEMGFRNSFGMPFIPYDAAKKQPHSFVEIPFQIMDGMFKINNEVDQLATEKNIINFIESNREDALIGLLWHNTEMTDYSYRYSFEAYKNLLKYFHESSFATVTPSQIVEEFGI